jgi:hypothetical protein
MRPALFRYGQLIGDVVAILIPFLVLFVITVNSFPTIFLFD